MCISSGLTMTWRLLCVALCLSQSMHKCAGSFFNPHLFPESGPFFEGWYLRVTNFERPDSVGLLFGIVLPTSGQPLLGPLVLASILQRTCDEEGCQLKSSNANFTIDQLKVTVNGKPVAKNPDAHSPSQFELKVDNGVDSGVFKQEGDTSTFFFRLGDISLNGSADTAWPWDASGLGPEGIVIYLPLPLQWFVFSLRSRLHFYEIRNISSGKTIQGLNGVVHLEKNWGKSFPKRWIWSEAVQSGDANISFALAGGAIDILSTLSVNAYLIGYRNPSKDIAIDFRPDYSLYWPSIDACSGQFNITAISFWYKMELSVQGSVNSFSDCLFGPESLGFVPDCVESYDAVVTVVVYHRSLFSAYESIDKQVLSNAALEFGGLNVCGDKCKQSKH